MNDRYRSVQCLQTTSIDDVLVGNKHTISSRFLVKRWKKIYKNIEKNRKSLKIQWDKKIIYQTTFLTESVVV